jgi:hypothetical protein
MLSTGYSRWTYHWFATKLSTMTVYMLRARSEAARRFWTDQRNVLAWLLVAEMGARWAAQNGEVV